MKSLVDRLMLDLKEQSNLKSAYYKSTGNIEYDEILSKAFQTNY